MPKQKHGTGKRNDSKKKWKRNCPKCNREVFHTQKKNRNRAEMLGKVCLSCANSGENNPNYGVITSEITKERIRQNMPDRRGNLNPAKKSDVREKIRKTKLGKTWEQIYGEDVAQRMRLERSTRYSGEGNPMYGVQLFGRTHTEETKQKQRQSAITRIIENGGQCIPNFNPTACQIIDDYGKEHGYSFQHAMNGGEFHIKELGYFVDGYDEEKNVVIEYYEPKHKRTKKRDAKRKNEIVEHLGCEFIELKEWEIRCELII